jgi:DNA-binding LacI/PurR family transcriptional regulator
MAIGVLSALASAGRRVPADVAVVSCDDMPFAEYLTPSLSSLRVPFAETGQEAVELLLRSIAGEPAPESTVRLPVELIVRDSCGGRAPGASSSPPGARPADVTSPGASPAHREKQKEDP